MEKDIINYSLLIVAFLGLAILAFQFFSFKKRINELIGGKSKKDIELVLDKYVKGVKKYFDDIEELKDFSKKLYSIGEKSIQKVGIVRFNPFGDVGGDQSFSIALLNLSNSGVIITSLYGREGTRVYAKPVKKGKSEHHLSEEETKSIEYAIANYKKEII